MKKVKFISLDEDNVRVQKMARTLVEKGHDVEVLLLDRKTINKTEDHVSSTANDIKLTRFYCRKKETDNYNEYRKKIIYFFWFLSFILKIKKYLKNNDCDYIISQANIGTFAGLKVRRKNTKILYDMRELYEGRGKKISLFLKMFNNYLFKRCDYIIYLNDKQKSMMKEKYFNKLIFLPNYATHSHFNNIDKTKSDKIRISYIGCPRDYLSLSNLIVSSQEFNNIEVFIHGMGSAYDDLKQLEKKYHNLIVTGRYDGITDSEELYRKTDLLFCGYDTQNINWKNAVAVKYYEAIITLTPVLVFKDSVMGDLTNKYKNGFLVCENTIAGFKKALSEVNKRKLAEITKNIKPIQYLYTWERIVENLCNIIE